ncbi:MAG: DNA polymerase III subunit beta [Patescibacteria group bacterium]
MSIETINEILAEAISKASKIAVKNPQTPILEYVHVEVMDASTVKISGYNLDTYVSQEVFVKTKDFDEKRKVSICVQGGLILSFLALFGKNEKVELEITDSNVKITVMDQESTIRCVSALEYPKAPVNDSSIQDGVVDTQALKLSSETIIEGVQAVSFASAVTSIKPELSCVLLSLQEETLVFVATDGFRLAEKKIPLKGIDSKSSDLEVFKQVLIPAKIWQDCLKVLPSNVSVSISIQKGLCFINYPEGSISLRTVSGSYPNYKAILPNAFITNIEIDTDAFLQGLKVSHIFSDEFNYVKLDVADSSLLLNSKNSKVGESNSKKNILKKGENISQSYNHRYLSDFVSKVKGDTITFDISGKATPSILKVKGDTTYTYLVMPMNR